MRIPRIYHPQPLQANTELALTDEAANHVGRVLRMTEGQSLQLFDGSNQIFDAEIIRADKKNLIVRLAEGQWEDREGYFSWGKNGVYRPEIH